MTIESLDERDIAQRAYALWDARGRPIGSPQQDWFEAETQLRAELGGPSQPKATLDAPGEERADKLINDVDRSNGTSHSENRQEDVAAQPTYILPEVSSQSKGQRRRSSSARSAR